MGTEERPYDSSGASVRNGSDSGAVRSRHPSDRVERTEPPMTEAMEHAHFVQSGQETTHQSSFSPCSRNSGSTSQIRHSQHSDEERHRKSSNGKHSPHSGKDRHHRVQVKDSGSSSQLNCSLHSDEEKHGKSLQVEERHVKDEPMKNSACSGEDRDCQSQRPSTSPADKTSTRQKIHHSTADSRPSTSPTDKTFTRHNINHSSADSRWEEKSPNSSLKERDSTEKTGKVSPAQKENSKSLSERPSDKTSSGHKLVTGQYSSKDHHCQHSSHSDSGLAKQSAESKRHSVNSSVHSNSSPEKNGDSHDQFCEGRALKGDNRGQSPHNSNQGPGKNICDRDTAKSLEVHSQEDKHSPDSHTSPEGDHHNISGSDQLKSQHSHHKSGSDHYKSQHSHHKSPGSNHKSHHSHHRSESDHHHSKSQHSSHSYKDHSASRDSHTSKVSKTTEVYTAHSSSEKQASEESRTKNRQLQTSGPDEKKHFDEEPRDGRSGEGQIKDVLKMEAGKQISGGDRKKRVSIQLEEDSCSQSGSLKSIASEAGSGKMETGSPAAPLISSVSQSKKEHGHSERQPSAENKECCVHSTSASEQHTSKSGVAKDRRHSLAESHSSVGHKSPRRLSSSRKRIEIKEISVIVNKDAGYVTSPDISSDEEGEEEEKGRPGESAVKEHSVSAGCMRRESTSSQSKDEVGPTQLAKSQLMPTVQRQGGSYQERLKLIEKLQNVRQRMDESNEYMRKRAARGDVKRRRAKREKLEGDFSGSCLDKINYNPEEKPSLKRPEPKPQSPPKEKIEKPKKVRKVSTSKTKEKHQSKQHESARSTYPLKDSNISKYRETKHRRYLSSDEDEDTKTKQSVQETRTSSPLSADQSDPASVLDRNALKAEFDQKRALWKALFNKPKEASSDSAPAASGSNTICSPSDKRPRTPTDYDEDGQKEKRRSTSSDGDGEDCQ